MKLLQHQLQLRKFILVGLVLNLSVLHVTTVCGQNWEWATSIVTGGQIEPSSICMDLDDNLYVAGRFFSRSYCHFGGDSINQYYLNSTFVTKLNSEGDFQWVIKGGANNSEQTNGSSVSFNPHSDSLLVHSAFWGPYHKIGDCYLTDGGTTSHGGNGGPFYYHLTHHDLQDGACNQLRTSFSLSMNIMDFDEEGSGYGFVSPKGYPGAVYNGIAVDSGLYMVKINAIDFSNVWTKQIFYDDQYGWSTTLKYSKGNLYLIGRLGVGSTTLFADTSITSSTSYDAFIAKFDTTGTLCWVKKPIDGLTYPSTITSFDTDGFGNIYVLGRFYNPVSFGETVLTPPDTASWFLSKLDENGGLLWLRQMDVYGGEPGYPKIKTDREGNSYLVGGFSGRMEFEQYTFETESALGIVGKFDSDGNCVGVLTYSTRIPDWIVIPVLDDGGNCYVAGTFSGPAKFGAFEMSTPISVYAYGNLTHYATNTFMAKANFNESSWEDALEMESDLFILPNPTSEFCTVQVPLDFIGQSGLTVKFFDILGNLVLEVEANEGSEWVKLNVGKLSVGVYVIRLGNNTVERKGKLVIHK
ncbi:MAG: T9SS type A sorting domain-containing protein [Flavobacteriales bacterium]|nr:T9SS type A sorting domain-containing protein [Flavobacteriales bacterium]